MKKLLLIAMALCTMQYVALAGGFKIGLQGIKQVAMAHTGIGLAQDATTIYFNPAGLTFVDNQINVGVHAIMPRVQFFDANTNIGTYAENQTFTPFSLYGSYHFKNTPLTGGLGVYTPFGSGVAYPTDWSGRFILTSINLTNVYIQPTLAVKVTDNLSFGAGVVYSLGHVDLQRQIPLTSNGGQDEASGQLEGNANGWGYNLGMYFKAGKTFTGGITYHSRVDMKVDNGSATFTNIPNAAIGSFPNTAFTTELPLPSELGIGAAFKVKKDLTLAVDLNYTMWNSFESLGFDYAENTDRLTDDASPRNYENAWCARAGLQWDVSKRTTVRGGLFYDKTPVMDDFVNPELPDNDKAGVSIGGTYWLEDRLSIDFSFLYEDVAARKVLNTETLLHGTYRTKAFIPGVGVNYLFNKKVKKRVTRNH